MMVLKFEGSSLENREALSYIKNIAESGNRPCVVVISALDGVIDLLNEMFERAIRKGCGFEAGIEELGKRHSQLARRLFSGQKLATYLNELKLHLEQLHNLLCNAGVLKQSVVSSRDYVLAKGDLLASLLFVKVLDEASWRDSRKFIVTNENFGVAEILWEDTCRAIGQEFESFNGVAVVPGFCGKTKSGYTTTLGPVGINLSAAIITAAFHDLGVA